MKNCKSTNFLLFPGHKAGCACGNRRVELTRVGGGSFNFRLQCSEKIPEISSFPISKWPQGRVSLLLCVGNTAVPRQICNTSRRRFIEEIASRNNGPRKKCLLKSLQCHRSSFPRKTMTSRDVALCPNRNLFKRNF